MVMGKSRNVQLKCIQINNKILNISQRQVWSFTTNTCNSFQFGTQRMKSPWRCDALFRLDKRMYLSHSGVLTFLSSQHFSGQSQRPEVKISHFENWLYFFCMSNVFHTGKCLHGGGVFLKISFYSLLHFRLFHLYWTYITQLLFHFITIYDVSLVTCIRVSNSRGQSGLLPRLTGPPMHQQLRKGRRPLP